MATPGVTWHGKTVMVTGCTGLVGRHLVRRLYGAGARIVGVSRRLVANEEFADCMDMAAGSVSDHAFLERTMGAWPISMVFHLAAQTQVGTARESPRETFEANIQGTWNLLDAVRTCGRPASVVLSSSDAVYGDAGENAFTETDGMGGRFPYDVSKGCAELIGESYYRTYGTPVSIARTSNIYGGGDLNFERLVPGTIQSIMRGEPPIIRGSANARRDYMYAADAVDGYIALAEATESMAIGGEAVNFCTGASETVENIVQTVLRLMGREELQPVIQGKPVKEAAARRCSPQKAWDRLHWSAGTSLETGLTETIAWYRGNAA